MAGKSAIINLELYFLIHLVKNQFCCSITRYKKLSINCTYICFRNTFTKRALNISLECWRKNYVRAVREIFKLPTLLIMCAVIHIPAIRRLVFYPCNREFFVYIFIYFRDALQIMCKAYRSKSITFPSIVIKELFGYNDLTEVLCDCTYFGIKIVGGNLAFYDSTFNAEQPEVFILHLKLLIVIYCISSFSDCQNVFE